MTGPQDDNDPTQGTSQGPDEGATSLWGVGSGAPRNVQPWQRTPGPQTGSTPPQTPPTVVLGQGSGASPQGPGPSTGGPVPPVGTTPPTQIVQPPSGPQYQQPVAAEPARRTSRGLVIGLVAEVLVAAVAVGLLVRQMAGGDDDLQAVPATSQSAQQSVDPAPSPSPSAAPSTRKVGAAASNAATAAGPVNNAASKPSPELVKSLFNRPGSQLSFVSLTSDGKVAVAYEPATNTHFVMVADGDHWVPLSDSSDSGVISEDSDCSVLMGLGDKEAVDTSAVMNEKYCDRYVVRALAASHPIVLGKMAGIGPVNLDKSTSELEPIGLIPPGVGSGCTRSTPTYEGYDGFVSAVWTQSGESQAYLVTGGDNASSNGARIGITGGQLVAAYSGLSLADVTSTCLPMGYDSALAYVYKGREVDYLLRDGVVEAYVVRNSNFDPGSC